MPNVPIYLDAHATTPCDPRVVEAMLPYFAERFGNPASRSHAYGWEAEKAVDVARRQVAALLGAAPKEIVFTSGATESNNLAIRGVAAASRHKGNHLVTVVTEHPAVLDPCRRLEREGYRVTYLPVDSDGLVDLNDLSRVVTGETILISVMAANNEIGVLQPIQEIGRFARSRGVVFHTDAAQHTGKLAFDVNAVQADLVSLSAHKLYGPKGVGALYVRHGRPKVTLEPVTDGGGQERGLRPGTLNVPGIVGLGHAAAICRAEVGEEAVRVGKLRDRLLGRLREGLDGVRVNGSLSARLPNNLHVSIAGVENGPLMLALDDVAVSSGAACHSTSAEPSHVMRALGLGHETGVASIRFGVGRFTTEPEIDYVAEKLIAAVTRLRETLPTRVASRAPGGQATGPASEAAG